MSLDNLDELTRQQLYWLAAAYAHIRTLRLADGPDEVHREVNARLELRKNTWKIRPY